MTGALPVRLAAILMLLIHSTHTRAAAISSSLSK